VKANTDVDRVINSRKMRAGVGKLRNRRFVQRRGPLVVYSKDNGIVKAFRNIPGIELVAVDRLNITQLAPGGHLGRFIIWTRGAFERLDTIFSELPPSQMGNSDLSRLINSDEVQSIVRPANGTTTRRREQKKNPLHNLNALLRLNPYAKVNSKVNSKKLVKQ